MHTLRLIIRIFLIIHDVLQHRYDSWCSPKSWSSLLTSPQAENNGGACALRQSVKNSINAYFKRRKTGRMFSDVLSCNDTKTLQVWYTGCALRVKDCHSESVLGEQPSRPERSGHTGLKYYQPISSSFICFTKQINHCFLVICLCLAACWYMCRQQRAPALRTALLVIIMLYNIVYDRKYPHYKT